MTHLILLITALIAVAVTHPLSGYGGSRGFSIPRFSNLGVTESDYERHNDGDDNSKNGFEMNDKSKSILKYSTLSNDHDNHRYALGLEVNNDNNSEKTKYDDRSDEADGFTIYDKNALLSSDQSTVEIKHKNSGEDLLAVELIPNRQSETTRELGIKSNSASSLEDDHTEIASEHSEKNEHTLDFEINIDSTTFRNVPAVELNQNGKIEGTLELSINSESTLNDSTETNSKHIGKSVDTLGFGIESESSLIPSTVPIVELKQNEQIEGKVELEIKQNNTLSDPTAVEFKQNEQLEGALKLGTINDTSLGVPITIKLNHSEKSEDTPDIGISSDTAVMVGDLPVFGLKQNAQIDVTLESSLKRATIKHSGKNEDTSEISIDGDSTVIVNDHPTIELKQNGQIKSGVELGINRESSVKDPVTNKLKHSGRSEDLGLSFNSKSELTLGYTPVAELKTNAQSKDLNTNTQSALKLDDHASELKNTRYNKDWLGIGPNEESKLILADPPTVEITQNVQTKAKSEDGMNSKNILQLDGLDAQNDFAFHLDNITFGFDINNQNPLKVGDNNNNKVKHSDNKDEDALKLSINSESVLAPNDHSTVNLKHNDNSEIAFGLITDDKNTFEINDHTAVKINYTDVDKDNLSINDHGLIEIRNKSYSDNTVRISSNSDGSLSFENNSDSGYINSKDITDPHSNIDSKLRHNIENKIKDGRRDEDASNYETQNAVRPKQIIQTERTLPIVRYNKFGFQSRNRKGEFGYGSYESDEESEEEYGWDSNESDEGDFGRGNHRNSGYCEDDSNSEEFEDKYRGDRFRYRSKIEIPRIHSSYSYGGYWGSKHRKF